MPRTRASADAPLLWREKRGSHSVLDVDPQWLRCVRVRLRPDAVHSASPRLAWRSEEGAPSAGAEGVWIEGGDAPLALFDLARDPSWLLCGRVRSIWFEGPEPELELLPALPEPALAQAPREESGRWSARLSEMQSAECAAAGVAWQLVLFDSRTLESRTLPGSLSHGGELEFSAPAPWSGRAGLEWSLEAHLGRACVARLSGRR